MGKAAVLKFMSVLVREHGQPQNGGKCGFVPSGFWH